MCDPVCLLTGVSLFAKALIEYCVVPAGHGGHTQRLLGVSVRLSQYSSVWQSLAVCLLAGNTLEITA